MSKELSEIKESLKEVLIELMIERAMSERMMSEGVQTSSMRGVKASPLTAHGARLS